MQNSEIKGSNKPWLLLTSLSKQGHCQNSSVHILPCCNACGGANANLASHSKQLPLHAHTTMHWGPSLGFRYQDPLVLHGISALQLEAKSCFPDCSTHVNQVLPRANVHLQPLGEASVCEERD